MKLFVFTFMLMLSPLVFANNVTAVDAVDALEKKFGVTQGKRRNHTKGMCFSAKFKATREARNYTRSAIFNGEEIDVVGRFSHAGGNILADDSSGRVFGMALQFKQNEMVHNMALLNLPFFPVPTPEAFVQRLSLAGPEESRLFNQSYPSNPFLADIVKQRFNGQSNYSGYYYNSIHTFYMENAEGAQTPTRWIFYPSFSSTLVVDNSGKLNKNFNADLSRALEERDVSFQMMVSFPDRSDILDNPTIPWVTNGKPENFGTLTITGLGAKCEGINYDPMLLSDGIKASDDPVLKFRSSAYAISFAKRLAEAR